MNTYHSSRLFGTRAKVNALRVLANVAVPLSIREVAAQAGISHVAAAAALAELTGLGVVAAKDAGRARVHWLERRSLLARSIVIPVFEAENAYDDRVLARLAEVAGDAYSVMLFGSRARGEGSQTSDYDVLVVERDHEALLEVVRRFELASTVLRAELGADVSVLGYTVEQARTMIAHRNGNFMQGVLADGIVIVGTHAGEWGSSDEGETGDRRGSGGG